MSAPSASGPDMSSTSLPVSRHKRVGRAGVAQLREQRRIEQLGDQRAAADRREARLRPADDRPSLAATARSAAWLPLTIAATPTSIGLEASTSPARLSPRTFRSSRPLRLPFHA